MSTGWDIHNSKSQFIPTVPITIPTDGSNLYLPHLGADFLSHLLTSSVILASIYSAKE